LNLKDGNQKMLRDDPAPTKTTRATECDGFADEAYSQASAAISSAGELD
jgi:hypothetical protein